MAMAYTPGPTAVNSKVTGKKIKSLDMVYTLGRMDECMKATGNKTICMVKDIINGRTAENTKDNTMTIGKMDMEFILTRTVDAIKECGRMVSSMERVFSLAPKAWLEKVNGKRESDCSGMMKMLNH